MNDHPSLGIDLGSIREEAERLLAEPDPDEEPEPDGHAEREVRAWPVLSDKALYGLAGECIRLIEPHTEADPAAMLVQLLAGFGSLIGRTAYFKIGADYHHSKLFAILVGATASGRKGTSWSEVERLLSHVDGSFRETVQNGLSSGEGLIYHVRDPDTAKRPIKGKSGEISSYQDEVIDEGSTEKRAFVIEPEFARVLKVISREGNTLSSVIRQAWDTDRLSVMTKQPIKATEAHITIAGHITEAELHRHLTDTEAANGFANRFLWIAVRRSKYLPDGGHLLDSDLNGVVAELRTAADHARATRELKRDEAAKDLWHLVYRPLSDGFNGMLGSVTSRATAQVMRLACVYALLDCAEVIRLEHLEAALGLWQYCEDSAKYIFGMSGGDKLAEMIRKALLAAPAGLSKTQLHDHCGRNRTAAQLDTALAKLIELGQIEKSTEQTGGRPRGIFRLTGYEKNELNEKSPFDDASGDLNSFNSFNS
ncbi:MAG: DUF3987 domain-containing protein [Pyrinomonadaceae bacterium]|nr:DUF3987 domain-containing protein [Pyrinomonadaceae bacterium]